MDEYIEKHLVDILNATIEVESYFTNAPKLFQNFQNDMLRQRENACKKINELFDLNVSVKLAPEFNIIDRKEVDENDNK